MPKEVLAKENLVWIHQGSNPYPCQCQINAKSFNQFMFHDNSYSFKNIISRTTTNILLKTNT